MTAPLATLDSVAVRYPNGTLALDRFSLDVRAGELVSLVGASGCGKSTALRVLAGLTEPTTGTVAWSDPAARRDLGIVFQDATLMPWASVIDNVWLPLRLSGIPKREATGPITDALALVGLPDAGKLYPRELSGGMAMRVSIARALVSRPRLLLMDEPFAALDEITRHRLNDDLLAIREATGTAVAFVTHSVFEAAYLSDRIAVMRAPDGGPQVVGTVPGAGGGERPADFRTTPVYSAIAREASAMLANAMGGAVAA